MSEASDAITSFEVLGDFGADLHDSAHVVAADGAAFALSGKSGYVNVLPVKCKRQFVDSIWRQCDEHNSPISRVQSNCVDLDKNIVVSHLRQWDFLYLGLAYVDDFDCLHGLGQVGHLGRLNACWCEGVVSVHTIGSD